MASRLAQLVAKELLFLGRKSGKNDCLKAKGISPVSKFEKFGMSTSSYCRCG